ncbi:hypothetical protein REPUB_Repub15cG0148800 [Reevesia pubescens]
MMMMMRLGECILPLLLCCSSLLLLATAATAERITHPSEVSALIAVKKQLVDPMKHLRNWNKGDPCTSNWTGVLCFDNLDNDGYLHVQEIQLLNMNLSGTLAPELAQLSHLEILDFMWNELTGSIPKEIGHISTLRLLDLSWNHLTGSIPSNKLSDNMTTIDLSDNQLNGSIPGSFSDLPSLQTLSLENNFLTGPVPTDIWQNMSFSTSARLKLDLRNNSFSSIQGHLNPPVNVTLRLEGNPVCKNANLLNISQFCGPESGEDEMRTNLNSSTANCPIHACPTDNFYEYVPASPEPCHCALPLRIDYRLKSPSFSYFSPYIQPFEAYVTSSLNLSLYQLSIDTYSWEKGPRLRMHLKIFPSINTSAFNASEVQRIRHVYTSWTFPPNDFFGPYELLNFTLIGRYAVVNFENETKGISKGILIGAVVGGVACAVALSVIVTIVITRRHARYYHEMSRKRSSRRVSMKIDGVKDFTFKEMVLATDNFNSSSQVGQGGYGKVYKGTLSDKTVVAIKRAEEGSLQGQKEFLTEIKLLSRLHHRNLVSLVGYCDEEAEQMLVYEFMPNGNLRDWLSAKATETLNFGMRLRIALGSAKGILYLHTEAHPPVFHRDIKASNILIDSNLNAKVADFGLSRLAPVLEEDGTVPDHVSTIVKGTPVSLALFSM